MSFRGSVKQVMVMVVAVTCTLTLAQDANLQAIECPFPEGQDVLSEEECGKYSACEWTDGVCHMVDNALGGYIVQGPQEVTSRGFLVHLQKADDSVTMFGDDVTNLVFEVIHHEDYHLQIKIYDADNARYEVPVPVYVPDSPDTDALYTVEVSGDGEPFQFSVNRESNNNIVLSSLGPLTYEDQFLQLHTHLASTYLYGFGENTHLSFRHKFEPRATFPIFARDRAVDTEPASEYGHHPYYMVMEDDEGNSHSVLLYNSNAMEYSTFLLPDGTPALTLRTIGGIIDLHIFLGPQPEDLIEEYTNMVGSTLFPPYWYLGFQLSRWGYKSTDYVRGVRERMKSYGIPQDIQTFDIDYTDNKRDFTLDPINFGDMPELIQELHDDNIRVTLLVDPALVIDFENYPPVARGKEADVFIKWSDPSLVPDDQEPGTDEYMVGYVWPANKTIFPDFLKPETQDWWINEMKIFHELLDWDTIWIDMNEPANFGTNLDHPWNWPPDQPDWSLKCPENKWDSPPYPTMVARTTDNESKRLSEHTLCMSASQTDGTMTYMHYDVHSLYGWSEAVATYKAMVEVFPERRPMVLTRSTFPGSGQYAVHWLGDNSAEWIQMKNSIIGLLEFNMFGVPMVGADICGFLNEPDMEMCARWMELGSFYPFSRNHNTDGTADQDPAMWPEVAEISRYTLSLRYQYLPYLYTLFHMAHMHGSSVARPLLNVFPTDLEARDVDDQFMWGDGLMIAPVVTQGATSRSVYFPQGLWYDLVTGVQVASGPTTLTVDAPLEVIPLYVPGGTILPYQVPSISTTESRENPLGLTVALAEDMTAWGRLFWDDGETPTMSMMTAYMASFSYDQDGTTSTSSQEKADLFAEHFATKMQVPDPARDPPWLAARTVSKLSGVTIRQEEVHFLLKSLDQEKAVGPDKLSPRLLRRCADQLAAPLTRIFQHCLVQCKWPSPWKEANVVPVHKKKSRAEISNYRPVSLLSITGKILETIISRQMTDFFDYHSLLCDRQYGFRKGYSAADLLLNLSTKWHQSLDESKVSCVVALDIAGAFDRVWHQGLLAKLQALGIAGSTLCLLSDYLHGRSLSVVLNGTESARHPIGASVPQGSVLGPLLWNVYFNDLLHLIPESHAYADDCTLTFTYPREEMPAALSYINYQLRAISAWGNRWQVTFAPEKTQMMIVSRHHDGNAGAVVRMNGTMLAPGEEVDILGVKFDSKLTMKNHVVNLANKAARKLTALRRISHLLDSRGCKILYEAQVRSHLEYAPLSWLACPPSHLRLLDRVENRARRLISRLDPSWMDLSFQQSLQHRRDVGGLTVMYKANIVKIPHLDPLRGQGETSFYATRRAESSNFTLAVPFSRTSLHLRSYIPRMTRVWNTFVQHNDVNEITSVEQMKMLAHRWLQLHPVPYLYVS